MAMLKFNGSDVSPDPSEMSVDVMDISSSDSGRSTQSADMQKILIAKKRKIHLGWNNISRTQARSILTLLENGTNSVYCDVTYDGDPFYASTTTKTFYHGDISGAFQQVWVSNRKSYSKLSFDLIEK